jgi:hypothetical protein
VCNREYVMGRVRGVSTQLGFALASRERWSEVSSDIAETASLSAR